MCTHLLKSYRKKRWAQPGRTEARADAENERSQRLPHPPAKTKAKSKAKIRDPHTKTNRNQESEDSSDDEFEAGRDHPHPCPTVQSKAKADLTPDPKSKSNSKRKGENSNESDADVDDVDSDDRDTDSADDDGHSDDDGHNGNSGAGGESACGRMRSTNTSKFYSLCGDSKSDLDSGSRPSAGRPTMANRIRFGGEMRTAGPGNFRISAAAVRHSLGVEMNERLFSGAGLVLTPQQLRGCYPATGLVGDVFNGCVPVGNDLVYTYRKV